MLSVFLIAQFVAAQKATYKIPDSLRTKDYDYLEERSYQVSKDSAAAAIYLNAYIRKPKSDKNGKELVNGYQNFLHQSSDKLSLIYADSMIYAAKKTNDNALIGSAYLSKGIVYYGQKKQNNALDNYIIANKFISKTNDEYLIYKVKYNIAQIKYYLKFYEEAISLLKECILYFKEENARPYLNSLHSLGVCYNKIGNYGLCSETNAIGISECKRLDNTAMIPYFMHSEGINEYFKKNFALAIDIIKPSLKEIIQNKDFANESVGNFYIGKSYWALDKPERAIPYFQKVDQTFNAKQYIRPDLKEVYELLLKYYRTTANSKAQYY